MSLYENVVKSLIKWLEDWRKENYPDAKYFDWDSHAQASELPKDPVLMGPAGCGVTEESSGLHEVVFAYGVSTNDDQNLFMLREIVGRLYDALPIGARLPIYDSEDGSEVSWMVVKAPRAVTPVTNAEIRSVQFVELAGKIDPSAGRASP